MLKNFINLSTGSQQPHYSNKIATGLFFLLTLGATSCNPDGTLKTPSKVNLESVGFTPARDNSSPENYLLDEQYKISKQVLDDSYNSEKARLEAKRQEQLAEEYAKNAAENLQKVKKYSNLLDYNKSQDSEAKQSVPTKSTHPSTQETIYTSDGMTIKNSLEVKVTIK